MVGWFVGYPVCHFRYKIKGLAAEESVDASVKGSDGARDGKFGCSFRVTRQTEILWPSIVSLLILM